MCKPIKCPQCGHEFTPEKSKPKTGAWTPEEDEILLNGYQKERKLICEIAEELNRSQDATRNRLYVLRGAGKTKNITASVSLSAAEYDEMRAARTEVIRARETVQQAKATERDLAEFVTVGKQLIAARAHKRAIAPVFEELQRLIDKYEQF